MHRVAVVALLLVLAGCSGLGGPATTGDSTSPASTTTPIPESASLDYSELSPVQQRAFDRAVERRALFIKELSPSLDDSYFSRAVGEPFRTNSYVRKDGVLYELEYTKTGGPIVGSYLFETAEYQPSENDTVLAFETVPAKAKEPVRSAIENGSYQVPFGKWSTGPDLESPYVRYNGTVYRITVLVGDGFSDALRAERAG